MIAFDQLFAADLPAPAARWSGFPRYNFTGGNNDPEILPGRGAGGVRRARVLRREGRKLATYNLGEGPLGHRGPARLRRRQARRRCAASPARPTTS